MKLPRRSMKEYLLGDPDAKYCYIPERKEILKLMFADFRERFNSALAEAREFPDRDADAIWERFVGEFLEVVDIWVKKIENAEEDRNREAFYTKSLPVRIMLKSLYRDEFGGFRI